VLERIRVDRNSQRAETSRANRDPDVIDLARIDVRLDLEADRLARADDKFIRRKEKSARSIREVVEFRTKQLQHGAVATAWPEDYSAEGHRFGPLGGLTKSQLASLCFLLTDDHGDRGTGQFCELLDCTAGTGVDQLQQPDLNGQVLAL